MTNSDGVFKVMTFNIEHDGGDNNADGTPPEKWLAAHDMLVSRRPDILFRQEMTYSAQNNRERLNHAIRLLGGDAGDVRGWVSPVGQGRNPTGLFVRTSTFPILQEYDHPRVWRTPPTNVLAHLAEVPERPITAAVW